MKSGDKSDKTQVLFLSKLKLMDWERTPGRSPELLARPEVEMVTGTSVRSWYAELINSGSGKSQTFFVKVKNLSNNFFSLRP